MNQTACVTQQAYVQEYCARKHPGTRAVLKNNGDWDCKCPNGYVYRSASNRCVQQAQSQEGGADCGWMPTQTRGFLDMYRQAPQNNAHLKPIAEGIAQQARNAGCNQGKITRPWEPAGLAQEPAPQEDAASTPTNAIAWMKEASHTVRRSA